MIQTFLRRLFSTSSGSSRYPARTHLCGELNATHLNNRVVLQGWLGGHRALGGLLFLTLRDAYGKVQIVLSDEEVNSSGDGDSLMDSARSARLESVVCVEGIVRPRQIPAHDRRPCSTTEGIEVAMTSLHIISSPPPGGLPLLPSESSPGEDVRLTYRHLDLRRDVMQRNLRLRSLILASMRQNLLLTSHPAFVEIETPTLFRSSPEGAREFLVPSRTSPGCRFYALTQSPQQHKQLLMVGGLDRYFQVARCYRDEGGRADRQPEFTQLDLELAFPSGPEEVMSVAEGCVAAAVQAAGEASPPPTLPTCP